MCMNDDDQFTYALKQAVKAAREIQDHGRQVAGSTDS